MISVSLISGGSRGLGLAIVESLLARGDHVATFSRSGSAPLSALAAAHPEQLHIEQIDASDSPAIQGFVSRVAARFGRIDHCIANAAIAHEGVLATTRDDEIDAMLAVNLKGSIILVRECVRQMLLQPPPARKPDRVSDRDAPAPTHDSPAFPRAHARGLPVGKRYLRKPDRVSGRDAPTSGSPLSPAPVDAHRGTDAPPCGPGPSITLISSVVASTGSPGLSVYAATKAALEGFAKSLARELGPRGIRVNVVAPGFLETDLSASLSEENRSRIARRTALGRLGTPADIVGAVDFLTSAAAAFVTGQVLAADGG